MNEAVEYRRMSYPGKCEHCGKRYHLNKRVLFNTGTRRIVCAPCYQSFDVARELLERA